MHPEIDGPIRFAVVAPSGFARMLRIALHLESLRLRVMRGARVSLRWAQRNQADVLIYSFDRAAMDDPDFADVRVARIRTDPARVKLFLQLASPKVHGSEQAETAEKNRMIEAMALRCGAHLVMMADLMQTGVARRLNKSGKPNLYGYASIAHVALRAIRAQLLRSKVQKDGSTDKAHRAQPEGNAMLAALSWQHPFLPASLQESYNMEAVEEFLAGRVYFPSFRVWGKFGLTPAIDWAAEGANWSWQSYFTGLEFLCPPLGYWFDCANGRDRTKDPDALRAVDLDALLARIGAVVSDFVRNNPPSKPANQRAFAQGTICRRLKALLIFLLCCRKAADTGRKVDAEAFALAFQGLRDSFELLRDEEVYPKAGNHGVRQDILFVIAGLLLPELAYGRELLRLGLDRLQRFQIAKALSPDGVWLENSFGYHCLAMNLFVKLAADLRTAKGPRVVHDALRRMYPFAEAMIKCDGMGPLIGDTAPHRFFPFIAGARSELDLADGKPGKPLALAMFEREKDTYFFGGAGYFASHSNVRMDPDGSSAIFFATLSTPKHKQSDDLSVLFSIGATDLLIDGGTYNKEISDTVRNAARYDPASHNTYRIGGAGYTLRAVRGAKIAGLTGMWSEPGWAAARGFNDAYQHGRVERLVIHLKTHHAIIVIDRLAAKGSRPALFEQFWHISPAFAENADGAFASAEHGYLLMAFQDDGAEHEVGFGSEDNPIAWLMQRNEKSVPTPYIRRAKSLDSGMMASLFQWSRTSARIALAVTGENGRLLVTAKGHGFDGTFSITDDSISCRSLTSAAAHLA